jgi:hypothetical protein
MKPILAALALLFAPGALAADLYCTGTAWTATGQSLDDSRVVTLANDGGQMTASTFEGAATGPLKKGAQLYTGFLYAPNVRYWINLDRYSGEFSLMTTREDGSPLRMEFSGVCKQRSPQF